VYYVKSLARVPARVILALLALILRRKLRLDLPLFPAPGLLPGPVVSLA
jgi:hypothetical protein